MVSLQHMTMIPLVISLLPNLNTQRGIRDDFLFERKKKKTKKKQKLVSHFLLVK